jgi:hypothetical protein
MAVRNPLPSARLLQAYTVIKGKKFRPDIDAVAVPGVGFRLVVCHGDTPLDTNHDAWLAVPHLNLTEYLPRGPAGHEKPDHFVRAYRSRSERTVVGFPNVRFEDHKVGHMMRHTDQAHVHSGGQAIAPLISPQGAHYQPLRDVNQAICEAIPVATGKEPDWVLTVRSRDTACG